MSYLLHYWLVSLCVVQFIIIVVLINREHICIEGGPPLIDTSLLKEFPMDIISRDSSRDSISSNSEAIVKNNIKQSISSAATYAVQRPLPQSVSYDGVAAVLMLHSPTWFQRRYTVMIQNVHNNLPPNWVIQIFYTPAGQSRKGIDINPGIQRFVQSGTVIMTEIPKSVLAKKKKRFELMFEPWLWRAMVAEKVLIFGGNAVICSNSPYKLTDFTGFDYIGSPWGFKKGVGGDGGISIRSRRVMLDAIEYGMQQAADREQSEEDVPIHLTWGQEDMFYVKTLLEMKHKHYYNVTLASKEDTIQFSALGAAANNDVWAVSGTLPDITYDDRQTLMNVCPEMKVFYPALHDPSCFGAKPDGDKCSKTICALQKPRKRGGC